MIAIICHDAGGAEILSSYVKREKIECFYVLDGPAKNIFSRKLGNIETTTLEVALQKCSKIICGTSWQSDLEWTALKKAKKAHIPAYSFIDHWCNYNDRFIRHGEEVLPDEIWVGDKTAYDIAQECFNNSLIRLKENPYFLDLYSEVSEIEKKENFSTIQKGVNILFVCEPLSEHAEKSYGDPKHWGYDEFDALEYFFKNLHVIGTPINRIILRPHPSESPCKYNQIIKKLDPTPMLGGEKSLLEEIASSDIIVGCASMAMIVGLIAKRRVISAIPPQGLSTKLPHSEIEYITNSETE